MIQIDRRDFLKSSGAAAAMTVVSVDAQAQAKPVVNMQLGWLLSGNQIGEVCAKALGYYEQEGIELRFQAGGPNIDGVAVVAAGRFEVGPGVVEPVADARGLAGHSGRCASRPARRSIPTRSSR